MAETSTECHRYQAKIDSKDSSHTSVAEVVRVTTKGQLPPPARIRKDLDISECTCLLAVEVGDCIVHRRAETRFLEVSEVFQREAKRKGITRHALLRTLKRARRGQSR